MRNRRVIRRVSNEISTSIPICADWLRSVADDDRDVEMAVKAMSVGVSRSFPCMFFTSLYAYTHMLAFF